MRQLKIKTYHITSKANDKSEAPIYIRIILNSRKIQISTGIYISKENWDKKKQIIKAKYPDSFRLNQQIAKFKQKVLDITYDLERRGVLCLQKVKEFLSEKEQKKNTLMLLIDYNNDMMQRELATKIELGTLNHYLSFRNKIKKFLETDLGKMDVEFDELNMAFISRYEYFLKSHFKNSINTIAKEMCRLKRVIHFGMRYDWLKIDPFINYKKKTIPSNREYLTLQEIEKINDLELAGQENLWRVRDVFIFMCFSGISYADLKSMKHCNIVPSIDGGRIIKIIRKKTKEGCNVPLLPQTEKILTKYQNDPDCQNKGILLPVISNQKMNAYLKIIAEKAGVNKKVTCHTGRHSFATNSLELGVPLETVSKVLGHTNLKTTQIYAKITMSKINKDYSQFFSQGITDQKQAKQPIAM